MNEKTAEKESINKNRLEILKKNINKMKQNSKDLKFDRDTHGLDEPER